MRREGTGQGRRLMQSLLPRVQLSKLTLNFHERYERAVRGDGRPVALPGNVAQLYAEAEHLKREIVYKLECVECGYDVPLLHLIPPTHDEPERTLGDVLPRLPT